ncbi:RING finger protein 207-like isoform X2 [Coccinella septempunctata]|uniref:RING finger protein 207-like isoform X2 n=1 Tax=Coccinella septempunctata TaxID=41139 RepID=UPI001D07F17D|nr:RING finger protein 207-like isoform X2 [Coccinella septempunctata]
MEQPSAMEPPIDIPKNPLLCPLCHDYFSEPCILSCYHTFCANCLLGKEQDRRLICPFCRKQTLLKDGSILPPPDTLMRQLIDIANSENPPCSNCDKRDRMNMYYCNTCGQALCSQCRDNTHRAKMFSSHDILHMTQCTKEPKRCATHGEHFIMYSPIQKTMLCVNCFRDLPNELRTQCIDIDSAHLQATKKLERSQTAIMDLQTSVRDGIIALKNLMDELRKNMDSEKHAVNTFCQGMQEAMAKTHSTMIMEAQRQYESKDRIYRSHLVALGTVMPVLQLHLVLCTTFTAAANKYQFLDLYPNFIERLAAVGKLSLPPRSLESSAVKTNYRSEFAQSLDPWIGPEAVRQHQAELSAASAIYEGPPPVTRKQKTNLKNKLLEGESSFSAHCRSFESQIRELNQQFNTVKEKVSDLHKDITVLRKAQNPPLTAKYEMLTRECLHLDHNLDRQQKELERMAGIFDASWEEQLWRLRVEQEVFSCQRADVTMLRNELKHLTHVAIQLEPFIRSLSLPQNMKPQQEIPQSEQNKNLESLLEHIGLLQSSEASFGKIPRSRSRVLSQLIDKVRPNCQERERSKSVTPMDKPKLKKNLNTDSHPLNVQGLEAQIKEKIQEICRRPSSQRSKSDTETEKSLSKSELSKSDILNEFGNSNKQKITYKKIGKSCEKINPCSKSEGEPKKCIGESDYQRISEATSQNTKVMVHGESKSSPATPKCSSFQRRRR